MLFAGRYALTIAQTNEHRAELEAEHEPSDRLTLFESKCEANFPNLDWPDGEREEIHIKMNGAFPLGWQLDVIDFGRPVVDVSVEYGETRLVQ